MIRWKDAGPGKTVEATRSSASVAIRLVIEQREEYASEHEAIASIAGKLGIGSAETLRKWVRLGLLT